MIVEIEKEINDYQSNKEDILHWVDLKGKYRYINIINFLKKEGIDCTWHNVTFYIKYDKRILINVFKYIVFLEELFKSKISQHKEVEQRNLLRYSFRTTVEEYISIGECANYDEIDWDTLLNEKETIIYLRNAVVHNKILIDRKFNRKTLEEVLTIFNRIMPKSYRNGYIDDINKCFKGMPENLWHIHLQ